jgi:hypothetical protein
MINPTSTATLATSIPAVGGAHIASRATAARAPRAAASEGKGKGIFAVPRRARLVKTRAAADSARGKTLPGNGEDDRPFFDAKEAYDVSGYKNFKSRKELADAALLDRHWYPTNPKSKTYQRTVRRSFTLVGVGLHSGEWETVRVCPARAGEGRYFVRVAPGTVPKDDDTEGGAFAREGLTEEETEDMLLEQLRSMLNNDGEDEGAAERVKELRAKVESAAESPGDFRRRRRSPDPGGGGARAGRTHAVHGDRERRDERRDQVRALALRARGDRRGQREDRARGIRRGSHHGRRVLPVLVRVLPRRPRPRHRRRIRRARAPHGVATVRDDHRARRRRLSAVHPRRRHQAHVRGRLHVQVHRHR